MLTDATAAPAYSPDQEAPLAVVRAADRAYRLSLRALLVALALLVIAGLVSATRGAAGLPVSGVVVALFDALPGVRVDS